MRVLQEKPPGMEGTLYLLICLRKHTAVWCADNAVNFLKKYSQNKSHSLSVRVRHGVSFVNPAFDWHSPSVPVNIYAISYNIELRYNSTQLYTCIFSTFFNTRWQRILEVFLTENNELPASHSQNQGWQWSERYEKRALIATLFVISSSFPVIFWLQQQKASSHRRAECLSTLTHPIQNGINTVICTDSQRHVQNMNESKLQLHFK